LFVVAVGSQTSTANIVNFVSNHFQEKRMATKAELEMDVTGLTECLVEVHNAVIKSATDVLPLDSQQTVCQKIGRTLESVHGESIIERLET